MLNLKVKRRGVHQFLTAFIPFVILGCLAFQNVSAQQIAFPGAEGFGKYAKGGRGGDVYEVTNLNDAGPGSFRQGVSGSSATPLTIVFRVSGTIELASNIKISRSNLTIAGQTAPGDGICFKNYSLIFNGAKIGGNHGDIIIRFIRSRPGGTVSTGLYGFDMENCHDAILDHCSFSWANEEVAALYDTKNTTVQYCIMSEGLYNAGHAKGVRSYCGVWGGQYASYHHNLIVNNVSRTVRFDGSRAHDTIARIDYRNNVIYNWGSSGACYGGEVLIPGGVSEVNMVNNYYKPGPATSSTLKFVAASYAEPAYGTGQWYANGNVMVGDAAMTTDNELGVDVSRNPADKRAEAIVNTPFPISVPLPDESAMDAYTHVLDSAGAIFPKRDAIDARIVDETRTGTASGMGTYGKPGIIDAPGEVGGYTTYNSTEPPADEDHDGMADDWELANGLNPADPADRNNVRPDGYTMLEAYLNGLVTGQALPLKLTSFDAQINKTSGIQTQLTWKTDNENNTAKFVIERSADGVAFSQLAEIAANNRAGANAYSFIDDKPLQGITYYRLKMVDVGGGFTYSRILALEFTAGGGISVFPNPVRTVLKFTHPATDVKQRVKLLSVDGKIVMTAFTTPNNNQTTMDVSGLRKGVYLLSFDNQDKAGLKFIKE